MQPADLAIELRRRTPYEACDLGLAMLQRWRGPVYRAHLLVAGAVAALALAAAWAASMPWIAFAIVWWLKPLYDRVVLHVLSRAVFGEVLGLRAVLREWRQWAGSGLAFALTLGRFDLARSFNLPVRQLEGQRGRAGRRRLALLAKRARSAAVWLTTVCVNLEFVLYWGFERMVDLFVPAKAQEGAWAWEMIFTGATQAPAWSLGDAVAYAAAVLLFEPLYVAAGFGLYLNRRTLLEGWDVEVALRRLAEKRAALAALVLVLALVVAPAFVPPAQAQAAKDPKAEIAEVLKDKVFGYEREVKRWKSRSPADDSEGFDGRALGYALAKAAQLLFWAAAVGLLAWGLWLLWKRMPGGAGTKPEPYRPPEALFGMALAPETLPADVGGSAAALAREGRLREALSLLYRGALSDLVHRRGVELLASHTEGEALGLSRRALDAPGGDYLGRLVGAWKSCAYAERMPAVAAVIDLSASFPSFFAPRQAAGSPA